MDFLKDVLMRNGYPEDMFFSSDRRFLEGVYYGKKQKIAEHKVETLFFVPYIGLPAIDFGKKLQRFLKENYNIDVKVKTNYFSLKS